MSAELWCFLDSLGLGGGIFSKKTNLKQFHNSLAAFLQSLMYGSAFSVWFLIPGRRSILVENKSLVHRQGTARRLHARVAHSGTATHTVGPTHPAPPEVLLATHPAIPAAALVCQTSSIQPGEWRYMGCTVKPSVAC